MSANLIIDIGGAAQSQPSLLVSGNFVGAGVDMLHADTYTAVNVVGVPVILSGLCIGVQCSDSDTSGNYTDPTSGLAQLPTAFQSGGVIWLNSGGGGGLLGAGVSGQYFASGFSVYAGFQRTGRYVRAINASGAAGGYVGTLQVNFVGQLKTTGSGGGFSYQPGSGTVNV